MATQAIVTLQTLHCIRESDRSGTSHSEPYVWPFLASVTNNSFESTPTAATLSDSRTIIKNEMRAGDTAAIPYPVNTRVATFQDDQTDRRLLLVVGLWEADDSPAGAVQAGYQAFLDELRAAIGSNLLALSQATGADLQAIIDQIKKRVYDKVYAAIHDHLSAWEKTKVFLGWLNLDDFMGSDFHLFPDAVASTFTLSLKGSAGDLIVSTGPGQPTAVNPPVEYEVQGALQMRVVTVNPCQSEVDAVNADEAAVHGLEAMVQMLQTQLQHATPQQKPGIIAQIQHINTTLIPPAEAALDEARHALEVCELSHVHVPHRPRPAPPVA